MEKSKRGIGTMVIVSVGALGAIAAAFIGKNGHHLVSQSTPLICDKLK
jgi:hypothetical protein